MTEILDDIREKQNERKTFSYLSFGFAIMSIVTSFLIERATPSEVVANESLDVLVVGLGFAVTTIGFGILGFGFAVTSFVRKEPNSFFKWAGLILSTIMILIFMGAIAFAVLA